MFFAIVIAMLCSGTVKAQTWDEVLKGKIWRFQNPQISSWCVFWTFNTNQKTFTSTIKDMVTGADGGGSGTFSLSNDIVKITIDNKETTYTLHFVNKDKIEVHGSGVCVILANVGSSEDTWFLNYQTQVNSATPQKCWCCNASGKCNICFGKGTFPYSPYSRCTYCGGNGICKHCDGTGDFKH